MNFYKLNLILEMPMLQPDDLDDDHFVCLKAFAGGRGVVIFYCDENGQELEERVYSRDPHGVLDMMLDNSEGIWRLGNVNAAKGWGPLLFEIAIEYATAHGKGMMCDTREMSPDAIGVFTKYMNRPDVSKTPLPVNWIPQKFSGNPELHYYYSISGEPTIKHMLGWEKLLVK